jgi:hypothetical protein
MARKPLKIEELTQVDPQVIISALAQENASLRLDLLIKQSVIDKMADAIKGLGGELDEDSDHHSH